MACRNARLRAVQHDGAHKGKCGGASLAGLYLCCLLQSSALHVYHAGAEGSVATSLKPDEPDDLPAAGRRLLQCRQRNCPKNSNGNEGNEGNEGDEGNEGRNEGDEGNEGNEGNEGFSNPPSFRSPRDDGNEGNEGDEGNEGRT